MYLIDKHGKIERKDITHFPGQSPSSMSALLSHMKKKNLIYLEKTAFYNTDSGKQYLSKRLNNVNLTSTDMICNLLEKHQQMTTRELAKAIFNKPTKAQLQQVKTAIQYQKSRGRVQRLPNGTRFGLYCLTGQKFKGGLQIYKSQSKDNYYAAFDHIPVKEMKLLASVTTARAPAWA